MPTFTALTTLPGKAPAEALGLAMENLMPEPHGVGVFEIEDGSGLWEVGGYFTETPDDTGLALLAAAYGAKPFAVSELPETDWVAHVKRELAPVEAGRFFVYGSHDADKLPNDRIGLLIEAAMAFGTGHHGTTKGCLLALEDLVVAGETKSNIADIGCGTAVLAMAAARIWPDAANLASDIDPIAVEVADANLAANDMVGALTCIEAAGVDHPDIQAAAPFDLLFANILKGPLIELAPSLCAATAATGHVVLSGLLVEQAEEVAKAYEAEGLTLTSRRDLGEWSCLTLQK